MNRRSFIKTLGTAAVGSALAYGVQRPTPAHACGQSTITMSGGDMTDWILALGDARYTAPGLPEVNIDDLETAHLGSHSELRANIQERGVMAHNITYKREIDTAAFDYVHTCSYQFRMPYLPSTGNFTFNAQTLEGGFFIWDGGNTRKDYGLAFQWILNPWMSSFGHIRSWTDVNGGQWAYSGFLQPDTEWHEVRMVFDYRNSATSLFIDNVPYLVGWSATPKPADWGTETAARLQAEIISVYPGPTPTAPAHKAEFKDWHWEWTPYLEA